MIQFRNTPAGQKYKIKLESGRVLGPLDFERVRQLILRNQIVGTEAAREYPNGEWKDINGIPELAECLAEYAAGNLKTSGTSRSQDSEMENPQHFGRTEALASTEVMPAPASPASQKKEDEPNGDRGDEERTVIGSLDEDDEPTRVSSLGVGKQTPEQSDAAAHLGSLLGSEKQPNLADPKLQPVILEQSSLGLEVEIRPEPVMGRSIANEPTVVFKNQTGRSKSRRGYSGFRGFVRLVFIASALGYLAFSTFFEESEEEHKKALQIQPFRPTLPVVPAGQSDPNKSAAAYNQAMNYYFADTVMGYKAAAQKLREAIFFDSNNVKALARLASSYINLIDSSNKDANYFSVISKLIELSRAKGGDLPETVIADVELLLAVNKSDAARYRVVEYSKSHNNYGELFYHLALAYYANGDFSQAARYLTEIPENRIFSAKIYYLKGQLAEKFQDTSAAIQEYSKGLRLNPHHAKSHLRLASLFNAQGSLKKAAPYLTFLGEHYGLLNPRDLADAYYLQCQLAELNQNRRLALEYIERASRLNPGNHDYLLELYTLRAQEGESLQSAQKLARMYYFLGEGEKLIKAGKYQEAMIPLLQARQGNPDSSIPLIKMGDMFTYLHDVDNARRSYKEAAERAPNDIQVWSKYIQSLIQAFEWEEAKKAMDRFRKLRVSQSAIDKAAGDIYQSQGRYAEAQAFYIKAMARDHIDPDVYIAFGKSLMASRNFKDAPFFFALSLRQDPLNVDAIIYTAKCIAETESIERAIITLQNELRKGDGGKAQFLSAIAELQLQKGAWDLAQENLDQAREVDPDYAYPWKLQAQIYLMREGIEKDALDKALAAFKSYSDRNKSDPSGYLERFKIFMRRTDLDAAKGELVKIYEIYPKFPRLHYFYGRMYVVEGNHKAAIAEYKTELANNPNDLEALIEYGKELLEVGAYEEGLKELTHAMQLAPSSADAKQNAGWANYRLKHFQAAVALIQAALGIDQGNPILYKRLGIVYRDMGDLVNACRAFKKYLEMEPDAPDAAQFSACLRS